MSCQLGKREVVPNFGFKAVYARLAGLNNSRMAVRRTSLQQFILTKSLFRKPPKINLHPDINYGNAPPCIGIINEF